MTTSDSPAVQDFYPTDFAHCHGCGRLNAQGYQLKTRWEGEETVTRFTPRPDQMSMPGFVYGGLIASLLDCHAMATAAAASERREGRAIGEGPAPRYVTAMLKVDFLRPTPLGPELEIRGRAEEMGARKITVSAWLASNGETTARATVVAVPRPETMGGR